MTEKGWPGTQLPKVNKCTHMGSDITGDWPILDSVGIGHTANFSDFRTHKDRTSGHFRTSFRQHQDRTYMSMA
ncbi:hypothetical protein CPB84DRAFT_1769721 [Gymnopilus junonius]|uniref:Uncharacterized protein n=1 Tax=Gymnopilus junonius TaxID=109634 RepID=A0A9P5NX31_GYMJU|nr:hypothetical protein CPB84DRAFT_1769721 [Gymnopilus junonius]